MILIIYYYSQIVSHVIDHEKALREQAKKMNVESLRSNANANAQTAEIRIAKVSCDFSYEFIFYIGLLYFMCEIISQSRYDTSNTKQLNAND